MIFQDPLSSLNPVLTIGSQIVEAIRLHQRGRFAEAGIRPRRRTARPCRPIPSPIDGLCNIRMNSQGHAPAGDDRHGRRERS